MGQTARNQEAQGQEARCQEAQGQEAQCQEAQGQEARCQEAQGLATDSEIMERVRQGDGKAFEVIVDRHKNALLNYLTRMTGSRARAEDLAQDAFIRLYTHSSTYIEEGKLRSYLYRIATNLAISEHRKQKRHRLYKTVTMQGVNGHKIEPTPRSLVLAGEAAQKLQGAIAKLPMSFRVPLVLHEIEEMPYEEIAEVLNCKTGTVKSRISRGRKRLKKALTPYFDGVTP